MSKNMLLCFVLSCLVLASLLACNSNPVPNVIPTQAVAVARSTQVVKPTTIAPGSNPYPVARPTAPPAPTEWPGYPAPLRPQQPTSAAYPGPNQPSAIPTAVDAFALDLPLKAGQTQVTGRGPAGVRIRVVDAYLMGATLGQAVIGQDNHFRVQVQALPANHRIGIMIDDTSQTGTPENSYYQPEYLGPGAVSIPQVGNLLSSAVVQP